MTGIEALRHGVAAIDLTMRGRIKVAGEDRARLLHAMTTNHVQQMTPGDSLYAFFLDAQGRILSDVNIFCFEDHLLLDVEPERREFVMQHLDRYIIADDVSLEDVTASTWCISLEGPASKTAAPITYTGEPAQRSFGEGSKPTGDSPECSLADADVVRLEHFKPRYGIDITEKMIPQETQQMRAVHFQKGCYIGQEIVERVRARGHANRLLMGFTVDSPTLIEAGSALELESKSVGEVTSSVIGEGAKTYGLAIVRVPAAAPGNVVAIAGQPATLHNPY